MNNIRKFLMGIGIFILALPTLLRLNKPLPGIESYYFINQFSIFPDFIFRIFPLFFGFFSLYLFYLLLNILGFKKNISIMSTLLLLISTPFIYVSNYFTLHFLFLFINFAAFYLFFRKEKYLYLFSIPLFLSTALFGIYAIITILFLAMNIFTIKRHSGQSFAFSITILVFMLASLPSAWLIPNQHYLQILISDFGADIGIAISSLILAFFGFLKTWRQKYKLLFVYFVAIVLFVACRYLYFAVIYLNILIVVFAAKALDGLLSKKWELKFIKQISAIALLCTFLFSSISFVDRISNDQPSDAVVKSLVFLRKQEEGRVFSHPEKGFWITYYADKPIFSDSLIFDENMKNISQILYYSRDFSNSTKLLDENGIKYIWIDEKMKNGQVWTKPEQGLLFLFVDKKLFTRIYNKSGIEIWEYHPEQQTI